MSSESVPYSRASQKRMQSLYAVCQQLVDGRKAQGKRYALADLLLVLVLVKLAGMQSLSGAADWVRDREAGAVSASTVALNMAS